MRSDRPLAPTPAGGDGWREEIAVMQAENAQLRQSDSLHAEVARLQTRCSA